MRRRMKSLRFHSEEVEEQFEARRVQGEQWQRCQKIHGKVMRTQRMREMEGLYVFRLPTTGMVNAAENRQ